jgi:hypothetical protein
MWRSAVVRFGLVASLATVACWHGGTGAPRDTPIENRGPLLVASDRVGPYWCSIRDGEYEYPQMPCAIREVGGKLMLAKLAGSQRFRGVITLQGRSFNFDGEFYCPWGDCQKPLHGVFEATGDQTWRGTFDGDTMIVTLVRAPGRATVATGTAGLAMADGVTVAGVRRDRSGDTDQVALVAATDDASHAPP